MTMHPRPRLLRTDPASSFPPPSPSGNAPDDAAKTMPGTSKPNGAPISDWVARLFRRVTRDQRELVAAGAGKHLTGSQSALDEFASEAVVPAITAPVTTRRRSLPPAVFLVIGAVAIIGAIGFELVRIGFTPARATDWFRSVIRPAATLVVESRPAGAQVFVDGTLEGTTPASLSVAPGAHMIVVRRGTDDRAVPVTLKFGAQLSQYFDMSPSSAAVPKRGRISVVTDPAGARVSVDGQARGVSPVTIVDLEEGPHSLTATAESGAAERSVALEAGATASVMFSLPKSSASVGGWLAIDAPFEVQVLERTDVIGAPGTTKIM